MVPKICTIDGCEKPGRATGLCTTHYSRRYRTGSTSLKAPELRFWPKVDKTEDCWLWLGGKSYEGYGNFYYENRLQVAHRVAYQLANGPIKPGDFIDHMCHNPSCVRAAHLQSVTPKQNSENRAGPPSNNTSGVLGVYWNAPRKKWYAKVKSADKVHFVGRFATLAEAEAAVIAKRNELFTNNLKDRKLA